MTKNDSMDRTGTLVAIAVFVALVVDGMDLQMLALALPSLTKELQISSLQAGALSTYTLIGMGIGGIYAGWLADRIGRVRVTWWAVLTFTIFTGIIAFCHTYWQIAVMRLLSGFGIGAVYSIGTLLAAEYVPTRIRTTVLGALQAGWSVGYVVAALASWLSPAAFRLAAALRPRDRSRRGRARAAARPARSAKLARGARRAIAQRARILEHAAAAGRSGDSPNASSCGP